MRILLVEDEEMLSQMIAKGLRRQSYAIDLAYDGEEALNKYEVNEYDLIILDLNLPKLDGLEVLHHIREKNHHIKVLILSARCAVDDRVIGLDLGANDYLSKPFDFAELAARVRGLLRRDFTQAPAQHTIGSLRLDTASKKVYTEKTELGLTKKEYSLFEYLALHRNTVVSPETLIEHLWDSNADPFSNVLQYHIHMLKKKLTAVGCAGLLQNSRGQGYMLVDKKAQTDD